MPSAAASGAGAGAEDPAGAADAAARAGAAAAAAVDPQVLRLDDGRGPALELLRVPPTRRLSGGTRPAVLMVHGAYTDGWSWAETFMPAFAALGHDTWSVSLRGHGASDGRPLLDAWGLADYAHDVERAIARIDAPLVLVGSSMGGLLVQRLLAAGVVARAAVLVGSVPPSGMAASAARMAVAAPRHFAEVVHVALTGAPNRKFLHLLAERPMRPRDHDFYFKHVFRESARALWELAWAPLPALTVGGPHPPMLVVHGNADRMVPPQAADEIGRRWSATVLRLDDIGHVPMIEHHWTRVFERIEHWLDDVLAPSDAPSDASSGAPSDDDRTSP